MSSAIVGGGSFSPEPGEPAKRGFHRRAPGLKWTTPALVLLTALGAGLRIAFLFQPMMYDETVTYMYFASKPLPTALSYYPFPNNHLFHTLFVNFSTRLFGDAPWAIRLPAFIAGVLLIPATYLVVKRLFNSKAGIIAAALVAASSKLIFYSVNARGYTLQALIVLALVLAADYILKSDRPGGWVAFAALAALGLYTIPTTFYFIGAVIAWMLVSVIAKDSIAPTRVFLRKLVLAGLAAVAATVLLYLPVLLTNGARALALNGAGRPLAWSEFLHRLGSSIVGTWSGWNNAVPAVLSVFLAAGFVCSIAFHRRFAKRRVNLALVTVAWCLLVVVAQRVVPFTRVWVPLIPLYLGFSAAGLWYVGSYALARLRRARVGSFSRARGAVAVSLGLALFLGAMVLVVRSPYQPGDQITFPNAPQVARALGKELRPGDIVYLEPNVRKPLEYYFARYRIPRQYFYDFDRQQPGLTSIQRAYVIDVEQKRFPIASTLKRSNLGRNKHYIFRQVADFPSASVNQIMNL